MREYSTLSILLAQRYALISAPVNSTSGKCLDRSSREFPVPHATWKKKQRFDQSYCWFSPCAFHDRPEEERRLEVFQARTAASLRVSLEVPATGCQSLLPLQPTSSASFLGYHSSVRPRLATTTDPGLGDEGAGVFKPRPRCSCILMLIYQHMLNDPVAVLSAGRLMNTGACGHQA
jgi:hypothetical protein